MAFVGPLVTLALVAWAAVSLPTFFFIAITRPAHSGHGSLGAVEASRGPRKAPGVGDGRGALTDRRVGLKRGVAAVDPAAGRVVGQLEFQSAVEVAFDVQLLPGVRLPEVVGFQKKSLHHTFVAP